MIHAKFRFKVLEPPGDKMGKNLLDSDGSESEEGGVSLANGPAFNVNEDFARKFTHNKKREELRRRMYLYML